MSFGGALSKKLTRAAYAAQGFLHPMGIADTRLTLDEYRIQVLEKLKGCEDPRRARDLLAEVDLMLGASGLSPKAQQAFWQGLSTDLEVVAEESTKLLGKDRAVRLTAVVLAAQADIAQRLGSLSS
jgi:hypothetical protein